ncbi:uncharacterized protein LOC123932261 isoform X2 [Meles meles]|uniref:uncharacterized protein LOC123932261 isoform X1 n=1 Tax=Meles meles TaxID=9662 RepID=UPI001E69DD67|nr:uncharacterized protein LOC123932261 isoform X1 [Meles meles]XP_045845978.1 uncharacterized protein LOC123932261 isoform X2 [Meles meles]
MLPGPTWDGRSASGRTSEAAPHPHLDRRRPLSVQRPRLGLPGGRPGRREGCWGVSDPRSCGAVAGEGPPEAWRPPGRQVGGRRPRLPRGGRWEAWWWFVPSEVALAPLPLQRARPRFAGTRAPHGFRPQTRIPSRLGWSGPRARPSWARHTDSGGRSLLERLFLGWGGLNKREPAIAGRPPVGPRRGQPASRRGEASPGASWKPVLLSSPLRASLIRDQRRGPAGAAREGCTGLGAAGGAVGAAVSADQSQGVSEGSRSWVRGRLSPALRRSPVSLGRWPVPPSCAP